MGAGGRGAWWSAVLARDGGTVPRGGNGYVYSRRVRSAYALWWVLATLVACVACQRVVHGRGSYFVAWAVVAGLSTTPGIFFAAVARRRVRTAVDRRFWTFWELGLVSGYGLGCSLMGEGIHPSHRWIQAGEICLTVTVACWTAAIFTLGTAKNGQRTFAVDIIDAFLAAAAVQAPLLPLVVGALHASPDRWLALPAAVVGAVTPAAAIGCGVMVFLVPRGTRPPEVTGALVALAGSADAWMLLAETSHHYALPAGPALAVHAVAMGLLGFLPLVAQFESGAGLDRLSPAAQSRRLPVLPVVILLVVVPLVVETLRGGKGWLDRYGVVTLGALVVLAGVRSLLATREATRLAKALAASADALYAQARTDELTGLPNRRSLSEALPAALSLARRTGNPLCLAMVDLDHFKGYNDRHGHPAGDRLLHAAAALLGGAAREHDLVARYGGEEFCLILPATPLHGAGEMLERIRRRPLEGIGGDRCTFSCGVAQWDGSESPEELLVRADACLYRAKAAGRDRVVADWSHALRQGRAGLAAPVVVFDGGVALVGAPGRP